MVLLSRPDGEVDAVRRSEGVAVFA